MNSSSASLIDLFEKWVIEIQYNMMTSELFQPIGLELSCSSIVFETKDDYSFKSMLEKDPDHCPLAWNNIAWSQIHIFIEHPLWDHKVGNEAKKAYLAFLLCHEAEHSLLMHLTRGNDYDSTLFNIAGDMEIHNMFYVYNEIIKNGNNGNRPTPLNLQFSNFIAPMLFNKKKKPQKDADLNDTWSGLWEEEYLNMTAEEIYASLQNSKQVQEEVFDFDMNGSDNEMSNGDGSGDGQESNGAGENEKEKKDKKNNKKNGNSNISVKVIKTTYTTKGGQEFTSVHVQFPKGMPNQDGTEKDEGDEKEKAHSRMTRSTLSKNVLQKKLDEMTEQGSQRGTIPGACKEFLKKLLKVKVDWKKILKNSIVTAMEKDEYFSWAKPRHSLFGLDYDVYLPDQIESEASYGTLIVARDESGSMSNEEVAKAAQVIKESKEYYKKVIILKHDVEISTIDVLEDEKVTELDEKMLLTRTASGGTSHKKVFEYIRDYNKQHEEGDPERISACIFITDMESDIPETQNIAPVNIPRIWLVPRSARMFNNDFYKDDSTPEISGKIIVLE